MGTKIKIDASIEELHQAIKQEADVADDDDDEPLIHMIKRNNQDDEGLERTIKWIKEDHTVNDDEDSDRTIKRETDDNEDSDDTKKRDDEDFGSPKKVRLKKNQVQCPYCSKIFKRHQLTIHIRVHTGERPYKCDQCPKAFKQLPQLDSHKLTHTNDKQYQCDECGKEFRFIQAYRRHLKLHTGEKKYSCDECDYKCIVAERLKQHKMTHSKTLTVMCGVCQMMFKSKGALRCHMAVHNKADYKCEICSKNFALRRYLVRHKAVHKSKGMRVCEKCDFKTTSNALFENHNKLHVKDAVLEKMGCAQCEFETYSRTAFRAHTNRHNTELFPKCLHCDYHPRKHVLLRNHIMDVHGGIKDYRCGECTEAFITPSDMRLHMKLLHRRTTHRCEACLKYFTTGTILRRHIRVHCKEKLLSVELNSDVTPDPLAMDNKMNNEDADDVSEDDDRADLERAVIKQEKLD